MSPFYLLVIFVLSGIAAKDVAGLNDEQSPKQDRNTVNVITLIGNLQDQLQAVEHRLKVAETDNIQLKDRQLEQRLEVVETDNIQLQLKDRNDQLEQRLGVVELENARLTSRMSSIESYSEVVSTPVAFTAALTSSDYYEVDETIIFDHIITNIGSGYDEISGVFTCPTYGIYTFTFNIMSYDDTGAAAALTMDEVEVGRIFVDDANNPNGYAASSSNTFALTCAEGSQVKVTVAHSTYNYVWGNSNNYNTFTGAMLFHLF